MKRRSLLQTAALTGAATAIISTESEAETSEISHVDTNIHLFQWPFRRLPLDRVEVLVKKLRALNIGQAWAGSFEGILHRDTAGVNQRLTDACARFPELIPVGTVNPTLPNWETDLAQCVSVHNMSRVRLYPGYHEYTLDDPRFDRLLELAAESDLLVQIAVSLEDTRTQHSLVRVADIDVSPLPELMKKHSRAKVQLLNQRLNFPQLELLKKTPRVFFDTARIDGTDGVARLLEVVGPERVMLGTHAPFLIPEASLIRVFESGLAEADLQRVSHKNSHRISPI